MADNDSPDDELRALYRGLPREEPPPAIDATVLAAASRNVGNRSHNWKVPVSLAAVLVLSVVVTLRVADEQPGIQTLPSSPPVSVQIPKAPASKPESRREVPVAGPPPHPEAQPRPEPAPARERARSAPPPQREMAGSEPSPPVKEEAVIAAAPAPAPPPQAGVAAQSAGALAQADARAERRAPMTARSHADAANLASTAPMSPEAWLERIIELRASARHKEADASYEEFRRRYPDFVVPAEKLQKIAPPR